MTRSGNWHSPRCKGRKHPGFSKSKPFERQAQMSEQGASAAHLLPRGSRQEDRPIRQEDLSLAKRLEDPHPPREDFPHSTRKPCQGTTGPPPSQDGKPHALPLPPHSEQQDLAGLVGAEACSFSLNEPL